MPVKDERRHGCRKAGCPDIGAAAHRDARPPLVFWPVMTAFEQMEMEHEPILAARTRQSGEWAEIRIKIDYNARDSFEE